MCTPPLPCFGTCPGTPVQAGPDACSPRPQFIGLVNLVAERGRFNQEDFTGSLLASYHALGDPAMRIDFGSPSFKAAIDDNPVEDGTPLTAQAFGDSRHISSDGFR